MAVWATRMPASSVTSSAGAVRGGLAELQRVAGHVRGRRSPDAGGSSGRTWLTLPMSELPGAGSGGASCDAVGRHLGGEPLAERRVVEHRRRAAREHHLATSSRWPRPRLRPAPRTACRIGAKSASLGRPDHEPPDRPARNDVRRGAALEDDPVDARVRPQLLAPESDAVQQHHHRVEGVEALPRIRGRMRLTARERDVDVLAREEPALDVRPSTRGGTAARRRARRTARRRS